MLFVRSSPTPRLGLAAIAILAAFATAVRSEPPTTAPASPPGLCVRDGTLTRAGRPYRGFGVNCFDLFTRTLKNPNDPSAKQALATLRAHAIPFARISAGGFWPSDWKLYREDRPAHFARLDAIVREAESQGVGLIPSLFWHAPTVSDLVGEPLDQLGNPQSATHAFMRTYVREVVERYRNSPAIWGWEVGNEYHLSADLPNAPQHRPPVWPSLGTPTTRTARDELTIAQATTFTRACAAEIRRHDPHRIILSGNALPRFCAWHNTADRSWRPDTREQFRSILQRDNPDPLDVLSVHIYPDAPAKRFADAPVTGIDALVADLMQAARAAGKPLVVGEFGPAGAIGPAERPAFEEILAALVKHDVPLAALWVFDFAGQPDLTICPDNDRAYMLRALRTANERVPR